MFVQRVKIVFNFGTKKISMTEKNILRFMKNHFIAEVHELPILNHLFCEV